MKVVKVYHPYSKKIKLFKVNSLIKSIIIKKTIGIILKKEKYNFVIFVNGKIVKMRKDDVYKTFKVLSK